MRLYKQYVRPHLEFASSAWSPWLAGDIEVLEKVQEKALRMTTGLKGNTYEERCKEVGLNTLQERRKVQDLTQVFKILKGINKVEPEQIFGRRRENQYTRQSANPWNLTKKQATVEQTQDYQLWP